jgi:carbamoyltransferase
MLICGIHEGHNAAAAIVRDGEVVAAIQEERLKRVKSWQGFPAESLDGMLRYVGAGWGDVDAFVFGGEQIVRSPGATGDRSWQVRAYKTAVTGPSRLRALVRRTPVQKFVQDRRWKEQLGPLVTRGVPLERVHRSEHHRCHAATAYYGGGPDPDALVITLDGGGDGLCATVSVPGQGGRLQRLASVGEEHSVGILWALITSLMGMVPLEHEYKMMGMAPYAGGAQVDATAEIFSRAFVFEGDTWRRAPSVPSINQSYDFWRAALEFRRFDHICAGLQKFTEDLVSRWVRHWISKTGRRKLRLSGGVFMNVKLNQVLAELPEVDDLYVFPSCGDETNAIGAAWTLLEDLNRAESIVPIGPLYLGLPPSEADTAAAADEARRLGFQVSTPSDMAEAVAALLAGGEVVARVVGREEFGARALGNRSLLADPAQPDVVRHINKAIKSRDFWMPFACSIPNEAKDEYLRPRTLRHPT